MITTICDVCPHVSYCGLMISNAKLVKAGECLIEKAKKTDVMAQLGEQPSEDVFTQLIEDSFDEWEEEAEELLVSYYEDLYSWEYEPPFYLV